ncbi:hypothetical protein IW261DRAFT_1592098 [Armillaria novae-zelandiae]|uniref:Uncharacterized protein n=1 Tax=Armillaria novae-zelandiae TaxID=153914 RepID=A0AA39PDG6_9AGAR|nr:hypothetical protein IW261DRAFT_1592098 [Armillaria novae-zelandiae]
MASRVHGCMKFRLPVALRVCIPDDVEDTTKGTTQTSSTSEEYGAKVALNNDEEVEFMNELMGDFNFDSEDSNKGIEVYCEVVIGLIAIYASKFTILLPVDLSGRPSVLSVAKLVESGGLNLETGNLRWKL